MTSGGMAGELGAVHVSVIPSLAGSQNILQQAARQWASGLASEFSSVTEAMVPQMVAPMAARMESELSGALGPAVRRSLENAIGSVAPGGFAGQLVSRLGVDEIAGRLGLAGARGAKNYVDEYQKHFANIVPITETHMNAAAEKAAAASAKLGRAVEGGLGSMLPALATSRAAWAEFAQSHAAHAEEAADRTSVAFAKSQAAAKALAQTTASMGGQMLGGFKNLFPEASSEMAEGIGKMGMLAKASIVGAFGAAAVAGVVAVKREFSALAEVGREGAEELSQGFISVIHGKMPDIMAAFSTIEQGAKSALIGPMEAIGDVVLPVKVFAEAFKGVFDVFDTFKTSVGPVVEGILQIGDAYLGLSRILAQSTTNVEAIEGLGGAVRDIMASGAVVQFKDVADSIGRLNANIKGLDTTQLKELTKTFAEAEELVGHIDETKVAGIINAWDVPAAQANETLTMLVNTARGTGIQFNLLADEMVRVGPAMRDLGYDVQDTASFFALMTQQGEKGTRLIFGMNEAVDKLNALVGKGLYPDIKSGYEEMITSVQRAESVIGGEKGHQLALETLKQFFTPSTAPLMLEMIEKGIVRIGSAGIEIRNLHQDLAEAVEKTKDLGQTFEVIGQQISAALAPVGLALATGLRDAGSHVSEWLKDNQAKVAHWGAEVVIVFGQVMLAAARTFMDILGAAGHFVDMMSTMFRAVGTTILDIFGPMAHVTDFFAGTHFSGDLDRMHDGLNKLGQVHFGDAIDKGTKALDHLATDVFPKAASGINAFVDGFARAEGVGKAFEETINGKVVPAVQGLANPGGTGMGGTAEAPLLKLLGDPNQQFDVINKLAKQGINLGTSSTGLVQSVTFGGGGVSAEEGKKNWEEWFKENVTDVMGKTPTVLNVKPQVEGKDVKNPSDLLGTTTGSTVTIPVSPQIQGSTPNTVTVTPHKFGGPTGDPMVKGAWEPGKDNQFAVLEVGEYVVPRWMVPGWGPALEAARTRGNASPHGDTRFPGGGGHAGGGEIPLELDVAKGFVRGLASEIGLNLPKDKQDPGGGPFLPGVTGSGSSNLTSSSLAPTSHTGPVKDLAHQALLASGGTEADWPKLDYIFSHESSWKTSNPNLKDANAQAGNPSDGLGQLTVSNRKAFTPGGQANTQDAFLQTQAAIAYMRSRYGSIDGAYQHWLANSNYAMGGGVGHSPKAWYSGTAKHVSEASTADLNKHFAKLSGGGCAMCGGGHATGMCLGGAVGYDAGGSVGGVLQVIWSDLEDPQVQAAHGDAGVGVGYGKVWSGGPGSPYSDETNPGGQGFAGHHGHVHTTFTANPFNPAETYGLHQGADIGHGNDNATFPPWVISLGQKFGLTPRTYPGHQERKEWGYLNRGIDWYPAGKLDMSGKSYTHQDNVTLSGFAGAAMAVGTGQGSFTGGPVAPGGGSPGGGGPYSSLPGMAPNQVTPYSPPTVGAQGPLPATGFNPWTNPPAGLTQDQMDSWTAQGQKYQADVQDNATKTQQKQTQLQQAQQQQPVIQQQLDAANKIYQDHLAALRQMHGQDKTEEWLQDIDPVLKKEGSDVEKLVTKLDPLNKTLSDLPKEIGDLQISGQDLALKGFPKPPKEGEDKSGESIGQQAGAGLVKGIFQELGFPDVFGKPFTQWGIWKLLMGGMGFGAGLLEKRMESSQQMPSAFPGTGALPGPSLPATSTGGPPPTQVTPDTGAPPGAATTPPGAMTKEDALKGIPGYPGHYTDQQFQAILGADQKGEPPVPQGSKPGGKWGQDANKNWFYQEAPAGTPGAAPPGSTPSPPQVSAPPPGIFSGPAFVPSDKPPAPKPPEQSYAGPGGRVRWNPDRVTPQGTKGRWEYDDGTPGPAPPSPSGAAPTGKPHYDSQQNMWFDDQGHPLGPHLTPGVPVGGGGGNAAPFSGGVGSGDDLFNAASSALSSGLSGGGGSGDIFSGGIPGADQLLSALPHMLVSMHSGSRGMVPSSPFGQGSRGGASIGGGLSISRPSDIAAGMAAGRGQQAGLPPAGGGGPNINYVVNQDGITSHGEAKQTIQKLASQDSAWWSKGAQVMASTG